MLKGSRPQLFGSTRRAFAIAAAVWTIVVPGASMAQYVDCTALQGQISAASRPSPQAAAYQRAAQKQANELAKMQGYAATMGCNRQRFLFFGDPPPPQCAGLNQRIAAMQANLSRLRTAVQGGSEQRRRSLLAQYDAYCRNRVAAVQPRNFFEQLFGGPPVQEVPIGPPEPSDDSESDIDDPIARRGSMAVCVRKCDGGFFPVSYSATRRTLDELADMCSALCPNTETVLFTKRPGAEIDEAISIDGDSYSSLANADRFKTRFNPSCTCKPPNQSWAQALLKAEKLLANKSKRDLIVTAEKAEELSRPKAIQSAIARKNSRKTASDSKSAAEAQEERDAAQRERLGREQAAAADATNAGIAPGRATAGARYSVNDGKRETVTLAGGGKRTIRIIGPQM